MTEHPPARIAMCADPNGLHEHVPLAEGEDSATCFQPGCDCTPVVFVREAEVERLRRALEYALDAFQRAGDEHDCDYCRADAAQMERALACADATQRQDSLLDQLNDVARLADQAGCRDAANWIRRQVKIKRSITPAMRQRAEDFMREYRDA
jgi:hypothetical protein